MRQATILTCLLLITAGCTFADVKPQMLEPRPASSPRTLIVGEVKVADPLWEPYRLHFVRGVADWFSRNGGFDRVLTERPGSPAETAVTLTGTITEVDKGSAALRWIVGMGAGQAKVRGDFRILDAASGRDLAKFSAHESYLGGAGIGGAGFLDMEDLVRRFAETVAATTRKWARGEAIE